MSRLRLYLLGPPRLELDGEPVHLPRHKAIALLVYLAMTGRAHSRDSLATLLWPEYDQRSARADLEERLRICREGDRILVEEVPTIIATYQRHGLLVKPWVTRLPLSTTGGTWSKDVVIEPH